VARVGDGGRRREHRHAGDGGPRRKRRPRSVEGAEPMAVVADGVPRWRWRAGGGCGQVEGGGVVVN
jgi:hypothetical protein